MKRTVPYFMLASLLLMTACQNHKRDYDAEGFFESTEVIVSSEANGVILSMDIREGDEVEKGQVVGTIDSTQLYLAKMQLLKSLESVEGNSPDVKKQVSVLEEQIKKLENEKKRVENLYKDGAATPKQLDDVNAQLAVARSQYEAQYSSLHNTVTSINAQSSSIEMQVAQMDDRLSKCKVKSPLSGTVLSLYAHAGEFAAAGKPLFKVADLQNVYLRAYFSSGEVPGLKLGQQVKVYADYGGDDTYAYDGTIEWISQKSEFTPHNIQTPDERNNLVYAVKIAVKNDGKIKLGMYGGVKFIEQ